jgi:hypothetical protein
VPSASLSFWKNAMIARSLFLNASLPPLELFRASRERLTSILRYNSS